MDLVRDDRVELVQLGHVDLDPGLLTVAGTTLRDAIGAGRVYDDRTAEAGTDLPQTGWRLVHRSPPRRDWEGSEVFAAPTGDLAGGGWAMVMLSASTGGGGWILSADPRPMTVYPGRAARRAGLTLSWPDGLTAPAGVAPDLSIELRNQTDEVWVNEPGDGPFVRGWLLDRGGRRCEESNWFAHGGGDILPDLQPGETVELPVAMASFDYARLGRGTYLLDAVLVALNLRSEAGSITLF